MSKIFIPVLAIVLAACGGQNPKSRESDERQGVRHEMLTEYKNSYTADSLLKEVVAEHYIVIANMQKLAYTTLKAYDHTHKNGQLVKTEEYVLDDDGTKRLHCIKNYTSDSEEAIYLNGQDTTVYELKVFDSQGHVIRELTRSNMGAADFDFSSNRIMDDAYYYDSLGRLYKKVFYVNFIGEHERKVERTIVFRGDTEEIITEKWTDLMTGMKTSNDYTTEYSKDTLIQRSYEDGIIQHMYKKAPGYNSEYFFGEDGNVKCINEETTNGAFMTETSWDVENTGYVIFYENGRKMREEYTLPDIYNAIIYEYDSRGNVTQERETTIYYNSDTLRF